MKLQRDSRNSTTEPKNSLKRGLPSGKSLNWTIHRQGDKMKADLPERLLAFILTPLIWLLLGAAAVIFCLIVAFYAIWYPFAALLGQIEVSTTQ